MSFIPYSRQQIDDADVAAVVAVLHSDFLTQGPAVPAFEAAFAARHATAHAVAVSNATAALHLVLLAMDVGPGSRIWTSPNSFVASANAALYCGATVDFVDIDPDSRNLSVSALEAKLAQGPPPDVLIPVDFGGLPCDYAELRVLADRYGFRILADSSHAVGATYCAEPVGSRFADASVFSFHAVKIVTTAEGGMVTTQHAELARRVRLLRSHGVTRDAAEMVGESAGGWYYEQVALGYNCRMTDLQAALGNSQLSRLNAMHAARVALADRYDALLVGLPVKRPARCNDRTSAWHLYPVEVAVHRRAAVFAGMRDAGIGVNVHYIPIHTQPYYRDLGFRPGDLPVAEAYYAGAITLPLFPAITSAEQERVVDTLAALLA